MPLKYTNTTYGGAAATPISGTALSGGRLQTLRQNLGFAELNVSGNSNMYVPKGSLIIGALFAPYTAFTGTAGDKVAFNCGSELIADTVTTLANLGDDVVNGAVATLKVKCKADTVVSWVFTGTAFTAGAGELVIIYLPISAA